MFELWTLASNCGSTSGASIFSILFLFFYQQILNILRSDTLFFIKPPVGVQQHCVYSLTSSSFLYGYSDFLAILIGLLVLRAFMGILCLSIQNSLNPSQIQAWSIWLGIYQTLYIDTNEYTFVQNGWCRVRPKLRRYWPPLFGQYKIDCR